MCEIATLADARDRDVFTTWIDTHIRSTTDFGEYPRSIGQQPSVMTAS